MSLEPQPIAPPHIDLPAKQPTLGEKRWAEIANLLFQLLDDIDTLYDMCKGDEHVLYEMVARIHRKRFEVAKTNGYRVVFS